MNDQTITLQIFAVTDQDTGLITAFFADDYATVTQGTDMDQVRKRLVTARNLVRQARRKYGFGSAENKSAVGSGFENSELTYQVVA
ncbi:hypothetical protein GO755_00040 [Spirosoma sp. HMF4905]|uniref:Uncharacterized protein n=1 Tax=Spirosoma arboris TaxID=2682092 RepID=A0A7K1S3K6_9BACT|nr:hypothetical protein [Spirosoma arboris]MVM28401.1 hypothetical protein [Spirosoma arboris]